MHSITARVLPLALVSGILTALPGGLRAAESAERVFTDTDGREIVAKIVAGTSSTVTIAMAGGKTFTLPIERFSESDRKFIEAWVKENPPAINYRLSMSDDRKRINRTERKVAEITTIEETWVVSLKLANTSGVDVSDLDVRYRIFTSQPVRGDSPERTTSTQDGSLSVDAVANAREVELATEEFVLTETRLDGGYYYTDGSKGTKTQKLEGIWVKVFKDGVNVLDYQSGNSAVKQASWPDEKALGTAAEKKD